MLRCAGCGDLVSEWAARCPACQRSLEDAEPVEPRSEPGPSAARAPELEPEPAPDDENPDDPSDPDDTDDTDDTDDPAQTTGTAGPAAATTTRRPTRARTIVAATAVTLALIAALVAAIGTRHPHSPTDELTGQILSVTDTSAVLSAPNGALATPVPALNFARLDGLLMSGDGRYVTSATGQVLAIHDRRFSTISAAVPFPEPTDDWTATGLTDHDHQLIIERDAVTGLQQIDAISIADSRTTVLGQADSDAGDPQAVGVFASVGSRELLSPPPGPPLAGDPVIVDSRVELRDAGREAVVLATAGQLAHDLGAPSTLPIRIKALPDAAGDKVALIITPVANGGPAMGIVVVDRRGNVLGATRPTAGVGDSPGWSPDGSSLVYDSITRADLVEIAVWKIGDHPYIRSGPIVTPTLGVTYSNSCLWASDGNGVLCAIGGSNGPGQQTWVIARPTAGELETVTIGLDPVGWLR